MNFRISLITATHKRRTILEQRVLPSVIQQHVKPGLLAWIVVNDETVPAIAHRFQSVEALFSSHNLRWQGA
jgi:hypothetical protein